MRSWIILGLVFAVPTFAFGSKRITVQELTRALIALHQTGANDKEVAASLDQFQLSDELTAGTAAALQQYLPGPTSLDHFAVLRGLSAFEPSAASSVDAPPLPDAASQEALLARTRAWIISAFAQAPTYTASKVVERYDEDAQGNSSGTDPDPDAPSSYRRSSKERTDSVRITGGIETILNPLPKVKWGENGQISEGGPIPSLPNLFEEAAASQKPTFVRWEILNGKPAAVFAFTVDKKKSHYTVDYCCFPFTSTENASVTPSGDAVMLPMPGTLHSHSWRPFKKGVPYHGLIYIDPESGAILRTITIADLMPFDFVRTEKVRVDYGIEKLEGKECAVPVRRLTVNETVPSADTRSVSFPVRHELLSAEYLDYHVGAR